MNPWDQPDGEGRGDISGLPPRLPSPRPPNFRGGPTGTYPSCRRGRTHRTPGPAPRTRSQFAVAASLASCELCAAGGDPGAPSRSAWVPSLGEDGELHRPECCSLWLSGSGVGAGEASLRGEGLRTKASWPAGKIGGEAASKERRWGRAVRLELRVPRAASALRAPWLGGEEATPARWRWRPWLSGLAQSRRWSRYLAAQPRRACPAAALAAVPGAAGGEHSVRPRAPRRRSLSQHPLPPSLAAAAHQRCTPASERAELPAAPCAQAGRQAGRTEPATLAASALNVGAPGGELSTGTFSPVASACVWEAVAPPPAAHVSLPLPPAIPPSSPARVLLP